MSTASTLVKAYERNLPGRSDLCIRVLAENETRAVYLHMHGGGFIAGTASMADPINSRIVREVGAAVVSVNYRLAPAYTHPSAVDDCEAVALWLLASARQEFGTEYFLIGGESAGATLAVLTLLRMRDRHRCTKYFHAANLPVGNYDFSMTPSQRLAPESFFLSPSKLREGRSIVFSGRDEMQLRDPTISPLYAKLHGLPPALFSVGTADSVLDDSLFMAARWQAAGNEAELAVYPDAPHLFLSLPGPQAALANQRIIDFLRRHCAG